MSFRSAVDTIERSCARHASLVAVESHDAEPLTFAELDLWARGLALELGRAGVGTNDIVALDLVKSREYVVGVLGTWYSGAAFLPLLPELSPERRRDILAETKPKRILTREHIRNAAREHSSVRRASPEHLAYVIYTSGSSGRPNAVCVPQRGLSALFETQCDVFRLGQGKRALFQLSTLFDASISDLGTALISGATLVIENPKRTRSVAGLLSAIEERGITHADLPPSLLPLLDPQSVPACLETLVIGGEPAEPAKVRAMARRLRVVNVYGPTEATVCSSLCVCDPERWDRPLLGAPLPGVRYRVVDGELYIAGDGLALGYLGRPDLDRERFVMREGERYYRTGDRVRETSNGDYEFLGRSDRQIKLHGLRIEPGEIEAVLVEHPNVREAAVALRRRPLSLVAFVALDAAVTKTELRHHLARRLPAGFLPSAIEIVERLPRTSSDKTDYRALDATLVGSELSAVTQSLLGLTSVDESKSFTELGGDSFSALELCVALDALGLFVPVEQILSETSLAALTRMEHPAQRIDADWLRSAATLDGELEGLLERANDDGAEPARDGAVFLTGATGALGSRILHELASQGQREVVCLVRSRDRAHGAERVRRALAGQGLALPDRAFGVLTGDLRKSRFGLSEPEWQALARSVSAVVHAGAVVNVALPYAALAPANVGGTAEIVRLAVTGSPKTLHYISTLSVFVSTDRAQGHHLESDDLSATRVVYGGYAQSKWVAERIARRVRRRATYRMGLLLGGSTTDLLSRFVRGTAQIGCVPAAATGLSFDLTPVEFAAATIAEMASRPVRDDTFHVFGESRTLGELADLIRVDRVDIGEWLARARSRATDRDVAMAYLALCRVLPDAGAFSRHRGADLFEATGASFDASRLQKRSRIPRPSIDLSRYVSATLAEGAEP